MDAAEKEYEALKQEQIARIGFRDNLISVNLAACGALLAFGISGDQDAQITSASLLVLPWVSTVFGWTYLMNDRIITGIGRYIREELVTGQTSNTTSSSFRWENRHQNERTRKYRKLAQLFIDTVAFVGPALIGILLFVRPTTWTRLWTAWLVVDVTLMLFMFGALLTYSDRDV